MIVFAGMIGVGKSTYSKRLAEELNVKLFEEPVDNNPILPLYYNDIKKRAFALQIFFLNKRFELIKKASKLDQSVLDRSIYEDKLFTKLNYRMNNISKEEYDLYCDLLDNMMEEIKELPRKSPDLLVYLTAPKEAILKNIKKRGREYEQPTKENHLLDYYSKLMNIYDKWYQDYGKSKK